MVAKEMLDRIMGAEGSPTGKLVALRREPGEGQLETGVWYSNFTRVHDEAVGRGLPFFAMWTNGDLCGFCKRFTLNILEPGFLEWMKSSGGLFWLGGSMRCTSCSAAATSSTWPRRPRKARRSS